jgi:hypothetical protein
MNIARKKKENCCQKGEGNFCTFFPLFAFHKTQLKWHRKDIKNIPFIYAQQNVMLCGRVVAKIYDQIDLYERLCCKDNNTQGATFLY